MTLGMVGRSVGIRPLRTVETIVSISRNTASDCSSMGLGLPVVPEVNDTVAMPGSWKAGLVARRSATDQPISPSAAIRVMGAFTRWSCSGEPITAAGPTSLRMWSISVSERRGFTGT